MGPPNGTYVPDVCAIDDTLQADADSLTLVHRRFPGFCPYHIVHNLLGGHYSRHPQCTASPFADVTCAHGSHSRPEDAQDQDAPAWGSVVFLPLGLSYRAGCEGSLVVGCVECQAYDEAMACAACGRRWEPEGPEVADSNAIWTTIHHHMPNCMCGACPAELSDYGGEDGGGGMDSSGGAGYDASEEVWDDDEEEYGEEEEAEWDGEEGRDGEEDWRGKEGWGEEQEEEAEEGEGEVDRDWGDGRWEETAHGTAWVVDYRSREPAPAPAPAPETNVAAVAAAAAQAAVAAVAASGVSAAAGEPPPAADSDWERRVRVLELESELAELKRVKRVRC